MSVVRLVPGHDGFFRDRLLAYETLSISIAPSKPARQLNSLDKSSFRTLASHPTAGADSYLPRLDSHTSRTESNPHAIVIVCTSARDRHILAARCGTHPKATTVPP